METPTRLLMLKVEGARAFLARLPAAGADAAAAAALTHELNAIEMRFALSTSHLYILAAGGEAGRLAAAAELARVLAAGGFAGDIDRLVARGEGALRAAGITLREEADAGSRRAGAARRGAPRGGGARGAAAAPARGRARPAAPRSVAAGADIQRLFDVYPRDAPADVCGGPAAVDYERCPACGGDMVADTGRSVLRCGECGAIRELVGTVFDDAQFYSQEGQKAKSGTFNPNRHFQFWWTHILAREPEDEIGDKDDPDNMYGERLLDRLRAIIGRERKVLRLLTVNDVRAMLREINHTDFNKNVPLIMKKLTGVGPPQVSEELAVRVENLFTKAIEIGERIRRAGRVNRNYYPFYIFKILERLVPESDFETRRALYYIYIQSKETVEADDDDWELICLEMGDELPYVPTDRTLGARYGPQ